MTGDAAKLAALQGDRFPVPGDGKRTTVNRQDDVDDVTVVVMTRDRPAELARTLPRHEPPVIVVDNASRAPAAHVAARVRPDARVLRLSRNAGAGARNIGVHASRTPFVAFADDDSWWAPGSLARAARLLRAHPRLGLLAARVEVGAGRTIDPVTTQMRAAPFGHDPDLPGPNVTGFLACAAVVRRDAFLAAGGFDPVVFFGGEEERLALDLLAAGWGMAYVDDIVARHEPAARDDGARAALLARNDVLTAWMRRPVPVAVRRMVTHLRSGPPGRRGVRQALPRLPAAVRNRRQGLTRDGRGKGRRPTPRT